MTEWEAPMTNISIKAITPTSGINLFLEYGKVIREMIENTDYDVEMFANEVQTNIIERSNYYKSQNKKNPVPERIFVAFDENISEKALGYSAIQINGEKTSGISNICYSNIYVREEFRDGKTEISLFNALAKSLKETPVKRIFFFAHSEYEKTIYLNLGGEITDTGYMFQLNIDNKKLEQLSNLVNNHQHDKKMGTKIFEKHNFELTNDFLSIWNEGRVDQPDKIIGNQVKFTLEDLKEKFTQYDNFVIGLLIDGKKTIGLTCMLLQEHRPKYGYQDYTVISKNYRSKGHATFLKAKVLQYITSKYNNRTIFETSASDLNHGSVMMNRKLGFENVSMELTIEFDIGII